MTVIKAYFLCRKHQLNSRLLRFKDVRWALLWYGEMDITYCLLGSVVHESLCSVSHSEAFYINFGKTFPKCFPRIWRLEKGKVKQNLFWIKEDHFFPPYFQSLIVSCLFSFFFFKASNSRITISLFFLPFLSL